MNKENLKLMADYIETVPQANFNMRRLREGQQTERECDSVGCVLGHCTVIDENPLPLHKSGEIDFAAWSREFTGLPSFSDKWRYLFSGHWVTVDNTPMGTASRIRYFLEYGLPKNWYKQMAGIEPPSYIR